jgi:uncharacterized membrane protein
MSNVMICLAALMLAALALSFWTQRPPDLPPVDVREIIDINMPVRAVFDEWAEFERYPYFIEGVKEVRVLDHWHMRWKTELAGVPIEFDAIMDEKVPDKRLAWTSLSVPEHKVSLQFTRLSPNRTRVMIEIRISDMGNAIEAIETSEEVRDHVTVLLKRCKSMLEERGRGLSYLAARSRV